MYWHWASAWRRDRKSGCIGMRVAVGLVESSSIAIGFRTADAMLKAAGVELLAAEATSPGKYLIAVGGDVASVQAAVQAGADTAGDTLMDSLVIPRLHPEVLPAIRGETPAGAVAAVGVVETLTVAAAVRAADAAVKTAAVQLLAVRLARGLGGKGYVTYTGDVGSVQAATAAASEAARVSGGYLAATVIPAPHGDLHAKLRPPLPAAE